MYTERTLGMNLKRPLNILTLSVQGTGTLVTYKCKIRLFRPSIEYIFLNKGIFGIWILLMFELKIYFSESLKIF